MYHNKQQLSDLLVTQLDTFVFEDGVSINKILTPNQKYQLLLFILKTLPPTPLEQIGAFEELTNLNEHLTYEDKIVRLNNQYFKLIQDTENKETLIELLFLVNSLIHSKIDPDKYQSYINQYNEYLYTSLIDIEEVKETRSILSIDLKDVETIETTIKGRFYLLNKELKRIINLIKFKIK